MTAVTLQKRLFLSRLSDLQLLMRTTVCGCTSRKRANPQLSNPCLSFNVGNGHWRRRGNIEAHRRHGAA